jgi:hypothetical protein
MPQHIVSPTRRADLHDGCDRHDRTPWPRAALRLGGLSLLGWMPFLAILVPLLA